MADSYTLSIEHKALTRSFGAGLCAAFAAMLLLTAAWKYSQNARHLIWKSESNYVSNQGRLDALLHARPKNLLFLGSSRTGRIPGAESSPDLPWDCLGLDASNAAEGVRLILNSTLPAPTDAAVEMESFFEERTTAFPHGAAATSAPFFFTRPLYRLSSLLYAELRQQHAEAPAEAWRILPAESAPATEKPACWTAQDDAYLTLLQRLQTEHGCRIHPLLLPERSGKATAAAKAKAAYAAAQLQTELLDLNEQLRSPRPLHFTDHTHLAPADAYGMAAAVYSYLFPAN